MEGDNKPQSSVLPAASQCQDWREIAERASKETDPNQPLKLVQDLCDLLEQRDAERKLRETQNLSL